MDDRAELIKVVWRSDDETDWLSVKLESTIILPFLKLLIVNEWKPLFVNDCWTF